MDDFITAIRMLAANPYVSNQEVITKLNQPRIEMSAEEEAELACKKASPFVHWEDEDSALNSDILEFLLTSAVPLTHANYKAYILLAWKRFSQEYCLERGDFDWFSDTFDMAWIAYVSAARR